MKRFINIINIITIIELDCICKAVFFLHIYWCIVLSAIFDVSLAGYKIQF